jgi:hypothetical protein
MALKSLLAPGEVSEPRNLAAPKLKTPPPAVASQ